MAPVAQQYWSVDDAAAASVLEHLEQMQTKHGPLPPPPSPVNAQHCNGRDFAGLFGPPLSQHDPPHEPQRIGWDNGTKRGGSGAGLGDISDTAPRLGPRPARFDLICSVGQECVLGRAAFASSFRLRSDYFPSYRAFQGCERRSSAGYGQGRPGAALRTGASTAGGQIPDPRNFPEKNGTPQAVSA